MAETRAKVKGESQDSPPPAEPEAPEETPEAAPEPKAGEHQAPNKAKVAPDPASKTANEGEEPDVALSMVWAAYASGISNSWNDEGINFDFPPVEVVKRQLDSPEDHNCAIIPLPREWVESLVSLNYPVQIVSGKRLPTLKVHDTSAAATPSEWGRLGGANQIIWSDYKQAHDPHTLRANQEQWKQGLTF